VGELRNINTKTQCLIWGVAAGRCEFEGCNKLLYRHEVTGAKDNYAEKAHIHAVNKGGARYAPESKEFKNNFENLILVCPQCHVTIDNDEQTYTPVRLFDMKRKHEQRITAVTGICPSMSSHMIYFTANTARTCPPINDNDARCALIASGKYPSANSPIDLSPKGSFIEDGESNFYEDNARNLEKAITKRVLDIIQRGDSVSVFALAPQAMLMLLGRLLNDKYNVAVFQCYRRESEKWTWEKESSSVKFLTTKSQMIDASAKIALVFSLSSHIPDHRIQALLGENAAIYAVTIENPNRGFVTSPCVADNFIACTRQVIEEIKQSHGKEAEVHVFPCMPNSLAVRFGMDYMPKTDNPLFIYDEQEDGGFKFALNIGGNNDDN